MQSALDSALGAGGAIVRVNVEYDRRAVTSKDVRRTPSSPLTISGSTQNEAYAGEGKTYQRRSEQLDRGTDTRESVATSEAARISRITAAVMVDATRAADLAQVRAIAAAALGISAARGDVLDVEAVNFRQTRTPRRDGWWLAYGAVVPLLPTLVVAGAFLIALRVCRAPLRTALRECLRALRTSAQPHDAMPAANVRRALQNEPPHAAAAVISALPAATAAAVLEMYPEHERASIVRRMQQRRSPLLAGLEELLTDA